VVLTPELALCGYPPEDLLLRPAFMQGCEQTLQALARELASRSITVNVVAPGLIETDMTKALTDKAQVDWAAQVPLGRLGTTADVAAAVCFLASDEASYITGQVLAVNGGMYM
jgi:3-oxoacyl-[acyl-carrier protein] reductase